MAVPKRTVDERRAGTRRAVPRRALSIAIVLLGVFVSALDLFIVNIAFPALRSSFTSATISDLSWVLSAYAITYAALLMPAGRWADRYGRKRAFLSGMALFTLASAGCAAAPSLGVLVAARVLQAVGAALMLPSSLGLLLPMFLRVKRGAAIGLWSAMSGAAAAAGPPIGGILVQADWRWVFIVNLPVGVLAVLIGWWTLFEMGEEESSAPDLLGALLLATTVAATVAAIVQGQDWGWDSIRIRGLFALGALGLVLSVWRILRHANPVIDPAILRIRAVSLADLATMAFFAGMAALILATTLFLTGVWRHSILRAGLEIGPGPVSSAFVAVPGGLVAARHGPRAVALLGGILVGAAGLLWAFSTSYNPDRLSDFVSRFFPGTTIDLTSYGARILPGVIISGIGIGLSLSSLSHAATRPLPPRQFAAGSAVMSMCRQVGIALGVAVVAAVLGSRPDLDAFHRTWLFMGACGVVSGVVLLAIGVERRPVATQLVIEKR